LPEFPQATHDYPEAKDHILKYHDGEQQVRMARKVSHVILSSPFGTQSVTSLNLIGSFQLHWSDM
jgi:sialic acid synthase SpsE